MTLIHQDLLGVVDAVEIRSPRTYSVLGENREVPQARPAQKLTQGVPADLASMLALDLYDRLYIRPSSAAMPERDILAQRDLAAALSAANTGRGTWEAGWTVRRIEGDGQVVVAKDGVDFWITSDSARASGGEFRPGETCKVRVPNELRDLLPGFYMAIGDGEGDAHERIDGAEPPEMVDRYYWHLRPDAAVRLVALATSILNASGIPFQLKVLDDPRNYYRADAGVLYVHRSCRWQMATLLARIYSPVAPFLDASVPLFTRRLADGLGFAEDPAGSSSFGQHRCRLIARALWESFSRGEADRDARVASVASAFVREGLDPLRPHLGSDSEDDRAFEPFVAETSAVESSLVERGTTSAVALPATVSKSHSVIEAASGIGTALCRTAYWDRDGRLCTWIGRSTLELAEVGAPIVPTSEALGPDLYAGSAGIALFLAHLSERTGNAEFRRAALGAIAHAIRRVAHVRTTGPVSPLSFFCGHIGVAYAVRRVAALTESSELDAHFVFILDRVAQAISERHVLDVIGGNAGAIPPLLVMSRDPGLGCCHDLAILMGEELCRTANRQGSTWTWDPNMASGPGFGTVPQTGLSHGAAGIGLALLELHAATGRPEFLDAGRGALEYEDSLFDPRQGNWTDLRLSPRVPPFARAWCHGAPGIALSRMRAAALDRDRSEHHLRMARTGIATTFKAIDDKLAGSQADASLVSGLAGLLEIVLIAGRMLDEPSYRDRAARVTSALIDRHAAAGDWPSGAPSGGPNPSLMLGTAGVGYTFLRLSDPERVPSILLFTP
jgi:hypothetical protein